MERVGIYEAKARLSDLVDQAARGREVTITKHGKPVAKLVPAVGGETRSKRAAVIGEILEYARTLKPRKFSLRKAIEWGRK